MSELFLKILNMSINAGYIVLAVLLIRLILKKAPKYISVLLWLPVAIRLICPFSFESVLSLLPSAEVVPPEILTSQNPAIESGIPIINAVVNPIISQSFAPSIAESANPLQIAAFIASIVWILGVFAMLVYGVISYIRLKFRVKISLIYKDNIYFCDNIKTPFILGVIRPKIYIPSAASETELEYIIRHENAHLQRKDHLWKPLGFLLLSFYWFNPLLWVAYILLCRDIELACDQKATSDFTDVKKKAYSETLVLFSSERKTVTACPLAFGEVSIKDRVKSVLNYKKPAFWVIILSLLVCTTLSACFLTSPKDKEGGTQNSTPSHSQDVDTSSIPASSEVASSDTQSDEQNVPTQNLNGTQSELISLIKENSGQKISVFKVSGTQFCTLNYCFYKDVSTLPVYEEIKDKNQSKSFINSLKLELWQDTEVRSRSMPEVYFYIGENIYLCPMGRFEKLGLILVRTEQKSAYFGVSTEIYDTLWDYYDNTENLPSDELRLAWNTAGFMLENDFSYVKFVYSEGANQPLILEKQDINDFISSLELEDWQPRIYKGNTVPKRTISFDDRAEIRVLEQNGRYCWCSITANEKTYYYLVSESAYNLLLNK